MVKKLKPVGLSVLKQMPKKVRKSSFQDLAMAMRNFRKQKPRLGGIKTPEGTLQFPNGPELDDPFEADEESDIPSVADDLGAFLGGGCECAPGDVCAC